MKIKTIRVLHIVGAMRVGGTETWLFQLLSRFDRKRFQVDILTHTMEKCYYDDKIISMGARLLPCLHYSQPWTYARNFLRLLKKYGPYDVAHSHLWLFNGFVMRLAAAAGVPLRIAHSHTTNEGKGRFTLWRRVYNRLMTYWLQKYSTHLLAVSRDAATALFGSKVLADPHFQIITPGIDLIPLQNYVCDDAKKESLGLHEAGKVVGHVGRFAEPKNHFFFLQVAQRLALKDPHIRFLLVGDGPLRPAVEASAREMGLLERMVFAGIRNDVPNLLAGVMDLLLFPSKWEGFGRVVVEAQAAGVPCLISDVIPPEVDVVKPLVRRLSLSQPPGVWAEAAWELLKDPPAVSKTEAWRLVAESPFNIENNVQQLEKLYLTACERIAI